MNKQALQQPLLVTLCTVLVGLLWTMSASAGTPSSGERNDDPMAGLFTDLDWQQLARLQRALVLNSEHLFSYGEEYINCLKAEGGTPADGELDLHGLITLMRADGPCTVVLESLLSRLDFDLSDDNSKEEVSDEELMNSL
jgi:hypothetical protein